MSLVCAPLARRKARPAVRRPWRRMLASVHIYRPIQRTHELDVIGLDVPRNRVFLFQDACASESPPLVRGSLRPADIFRSSPDRLGRSVGPHSAGFVEGYAEVIAESGLPPDARCF